VTLVSVIIPAYNRAALLAQTLDSALAQTHSPVEVIVVDDGSTDDTPALLERFAGRITMHRQDNQGLAAALNQGLRMASGDLVAFLDSDDLWDPPFVTRLLARLTPAADATVGAVASWREIDGGGRVLTARRDPAQRIYGLPELAVRPMVPPSGVLLHRWAVRDAGGFDSSFVMAQDRDLWVRLAAAGGTFAAVDEVLWSYRVHAGAMSRDPAGLRADGLRLIEKSFADPRMPESVRQRRGEALGVMWSGVSARLFEHGREADGRQALCDAVRAWPDVLREDETYWSILCADQPIEHRGGPQHLDLERAAARLFEALESAFAAVPVASPMARQARGRAHRAIAQLAYSQRRMQAVRAHTIAAVRADPGLWREPHVLGLWLKSLAGATAVRAASRLRRRA
jgi:hypothetical protein